MYFIDLEKVPLVVIAVFIYHGVQSPAKAHLHMSLGYTFLLLVSRSHLPTVLPRAIFLNIPAVIIC